MKNLFLKLFTIKMIHNIGKLDLFCKKTLRKLIFEMPETVGNKQKEEI